jgi:Ca2+-binding EF-hand superfamily protein
VNAFLAKRGKRPATYNLFNKYFIQIDENNDGKVSKQEMAGFIKNFLAPTQDYSSNVPNQLKSW